MKIYRSVLVLFMCSSCGSQTQISVVNELEAFLSVPVEERLGEAIGRNDYRSLEAPYAHIYTLGNENSSLENVLRIPSVSDDVVFEGVLRIPGTFDVLVSERHGELVENAANYASTYNRHLRFEIESIIDVVDHSHYYEESSCLVHAEELEEIIVPLGYGLPIPSSKSYIQARSELFPNAVLTANGGCVIEGYSKSLVKACIACNHAERDWLRDHQKYDVNRLTVQPNNRSQQPAR